MVTDCSGGSKGGGGARALPLFLDQNEVRRAQKNFLGDRAPPLIPLSASSDQDQFSPNDIHTLAREKVMRINISESV